jgi:hypothetical protein
MPPAYGLWFMVYGLSFMVYDFWFGTLAEAARVDGVFLRPRWGQSSNSLHATESSLLQGEERMGENFWYVATVGNLRPLLEMRERFWKWT